MRRKFVLTFSVIILIILLTLQTYNYILILAKIDENEQKQVEQLEISIAEKMNEQIRVARHSLLPFLHDSEVRRLFAERDREALNEMVKEGYAQLEANGISQMQFHVPVATSFLRVHSPEKFDDDLSSFRHTVVAANERVETIEGLEQGVAGYGFRVVAPVSHNGEHVGSVEMGTDFDTEFLDRIREEIAGDYYIYSFEDSEESIAATTDSSDSFPISPATIEQIKASGEASYLHSDDEKSLISLVPFVDYEGNVAGYI